MEEADETKQGALSVDLCPQIEYLTINEWGWVSYEELWRSRRVLSVEAAGTLRDLHNSPYDTKAEFNNCFIIDSK